MEEIVKSQSLCKLLNYNSNTPLEEEDLILPADGLILTKIFPYPLDLEVTLADCSQLMVYYPRCNFSANGVIESPKIYFDIVVAKDLFLIKNNNEPSIRPYEIMMELVNTFNKSIETVGKISFDEFIHITINGKFDCLRLVGNFFTIGV